MEAFALFFEEHAFVILTLSVVLAYGTLLGSWVYSKLQR